MGDKKRQIVVLLQSLSRIPGLGFLSQLEYRFQDGVQKYDGVIDDIQDHQEYLENARDAASDLVTSEEGGHSGRDAEEEEEEV